MSLDDHAFNKQQTLRYVKGYAHEAPEMTVQDPHATAGVTDMYRSGGYNPSTYTSSPAYSSTKKEETLPDWVVNNNKVTHPILTNWPPTVYHLQCHTVASQNC